MLVTLYILIWKMGTYVYSLYKKLSGSALKVHAWSYIMLFFSLSSAKHSIQIVLKFMIANAKLRLSNFAPISTSILVSQTKPPKLWAL